MNTEYDPALDPTPDDEEITPRDELIILVGELENMEAADFNLWRQLRISRLKGLIETGIEGEEFVFHPEPTPPEAPNEFDEQGFGPLENGCVAFEPFIETGLSWQGSNDRILEYGALMLLRHRVMLPIARLETDHEFQDRYHKNLTCRPHPPFVFGRSGYFNKPVYETITEQTDRGRTYFQGTNPIEHHFLPYAGSLQADIVDTFLSDWESGAVKERVLRSAAGDIFEMDRDNKEKWEGYWEAPISLRFQRNVELDLARANPDY